MKELWRDPRDGRLNQHQTTDVNKETRTNDDGMRRPRQSGSDEKAKTSPYQKQSYTTNTYHTLSTTNAKIHRIQNQAERQKTQQLRKSQTPCVKSSCATRPYERVLEVATEDELINEFKKLAIGEAGKLLQVINILTSLYNNGLQSRCVGEVKKNISSMG